MKIHVKLYAGLKQYIPRSSEVARRQEWEIPEGTTVRDAMGMLHLPESLNVVVLVNGEYCRDGEKALREADSLLIYPLMTGG